MTIPPPYVIARTSRKAMYYVLVELYDDGHGKSARRWNDLGGTPDAHEAIARNTARLRERERWAGSSPTADELSVIVAARARLDALMAAVAKMGGPA